MISSFEVGAVLKVIDQASPALRKILAQVRELRLEVDKARASLAEITKGAGTNAGLATAIGETDKLAASWRNVAKSAGEARAAMTGAASAGAGGNRGVFHPGARGGGGGGGMHVGGPGIPIAGGGHVRFGRGAGLAALGMVGYGVAQAMAYDDAVVMMATHAGVDLSANRAKFRKMLTDAAVQTGYGEHDISEAAQQELRLFADTGGSNGVDVLPKMLKYAAVEARRKGTSLKESMSSMVGLSHMLQQYGEADVDRLAPAFSVLSTRNPMTLAQQERAFGYAVPLLHSQGMDPYDVMAASTALARAGITSTKAGTWIREAAVRAMPGTSLMSRIAFKKHEEALKAFGLVDNNDKPTWFENGAPSMTKLLEITSAHAKNIPLDKRMSYERQLFGAQGSGAIAVLGENAVLDQMHRMRETIKDPRQLNEVRNWMTIYGEQSSLQNARTAFQSFNVTMADIGEKLLPSVNVALKDFKAILEGIRSVLPSVPGAGAKIGARAAEGALLGAGAGFWFGGVGAGPGAAIGGVLGTAEGFMESYGGNSRYTLPGADRSKAIADEIRGRGTAGQVFPGGTQAPKTEVKMKTDINLDGRTLASAISEYLVEAFKFSTQAPAGDGVGLYNGGGE